MPATKIDRPAKPYQEFPLFAHPNGQWCKKIKGKQWFFGVWADPDSALEKYLDEVDEIQAGRDPRKIAGVGRVSSTDLSVSDLCNLFLERQQERVDAGELSARHFTDCFRSCRVVVQHFGKFTKATSLRANDFKNLRAAFPATWGSTKTGTEIQRIRSVFKWGFESELIQSLPNFGPDFRRPSKDEQRREKVRRQKSRGGKLVFTAEEIRTLLKHSSGWLKACILLGINGGMGNADCGRLSTAFFDVNSGWYDLPREKTGVERRFPVWPETAQAIRDAMRQRPIAKNDADDSLCFLTSHGKPVWWETLNGKGETFICDNIAKSFLKLTRACKIERDGRNFYSLRRTFETEGGNSRDQVAVDCIMGHFDSSMAAVYRQGIDDQRLIDVGQHVHDWLYPPKKHAKRPPAKKAASK